MDIGGKIRELREKNGLSVKEFASLVPCTPSFISQIERGKSSPSVSTLKNIANALKVNMVDFFSAPVDDGEVVLPVNQRVHLKLPHWDAHMESLTHVAVGKKMQVFYTTIRPGGGSKGLFTHKGDEFGLVLKGRLELVLKDKVYMVEENETVYFSSEIPHGWTNRGNEDAVVIWVITPPTF